MILLRRAAVVVSLVALCASPALARRVGNAQTSDENVTRSQPQSPAAPTLEATPRPNLPGTPLSEDPPACVTPAPLRTTVPARSEVGRPHNPEPTRQPIAPDQSQERREKAKPSVSPAPRVTPRHVTPGKPRVSSRPLPATPGMGALLRMGITVGHEISFLDEVAPSRPTRPQAGRAPPATRVSSRAQASPAAPAVPASPTPTALVAPVPPVSTPASLALAPRAEGFARVRSNGTTTNFTFALGDDLS